MRILLSYAIVSIYFIKTSENFPTSVTLALSLSPKMKQVNVLNNINTSQINYNNTKMICSNRDVICKSNDTRICAIRKVNKTFEFKDFENSCYLFMSNVCDFAGKEFYTMADQSCSPQLTRRHYEDSGVMDVMTTATPDNETWNGNTTRPLLREAKFSTVYDVKAAADGHPCAVTCPHVYHPVCMNVNRNFGKYLKFFHFVNHCEADKFYCIHHAEFEVPPGKKSALIAISYLDWSYCGAQRYLNFMFTAQSASSMGHYGWLAGDERYSKILEPWQRKPDHG